MRAADVVSQLAVKLPALVDDFTINHSVASIFRSGTTVTVITAFDHGLSVGDQVNITGARTPIAISSINRAGLLATLVTDADHDFTETVGFENVEIENATESEFNGLFKRLKVLDRRTITFQVADSGPTSATGSPLLINGENDVNTYNGLREITDTPFARIFEYEITNTTLFSPPKGVIFAKTKPHISAAVTYERIVEAYTEQLAEDVWIFVVMGDGVAHKDRQIVVDSTANIQKVHFFNQRITQVFSLFLFIPSVDDIAARQARDRAEELLLPICQSILFAKFNSLLTAQFSNPLQFNEHGFHDYNGAFYVHRYTFEETLQMSFEDTVGADDDVAFRDIFLDMGLDVGTGRMSTDIDLDAGKPPIILPTNIPNLVVWLDAQDESTITAVDGEVSRWDDKSEAGNDVEQTEALERPLEGLGTINGKPSIIFGGGLHNLFGTSNFVATPNMTLFFAIRALSPSGPSDAFDSLFSLEGTNDFQIDSKISGQFLARFTSTGLGAVDPPSHTSDLTNIVAIINYRLSASDAEVVLRVNGVQSDSDVYNGNLDSDLVLRIGINRGDDKALSVNIGEVIIYNRDLTPLETQQVENYLSNQWLIPVG